MTEDVDSSGRWSEAVDLEAEASVEPAHASPGRGGPLARPSVSPEAMRDLAVAFRTSAETMEGVRELQGELLKTLKRQDRSELVLRSTDALNDAFRNLTAVQREILGRLEEEKKTGAGRVVPLMLIGLLVVFLGGIYAVVTLIQQVREERQTGREVVEAATQSALAAFQDGLADRDGRHLEEVERLRAENAEVRRRAEALIERADRERVENTELQEEKQRLELEMDGLAEQILKAQNEVMAKRTLEDELRATAGHLAVVEPKLRALEMDLQTERELTARLRKRLAALGYGLPDPEAQPEPAEAEAGDVEEADPTAEEDPATSPAPDGAPVERDDALLEKIRSRLNQMLDTGSASTSSYWQVKSMGGVTPQGLVDVELSLLARGHRRLIQNVEAKEVRFWVDRTQRTADMTIADGTIRDPRGAKPIPAGGISYRVARGEMFRLWSQSGLVFVTVR